MKDRSDDPSQHERTVYYRATSLSYVSSNPWLLLECCFVVVVVVVLFVVVFFPGYATWNSFRPAQHMLLITT